MKQFFKNILRANANEDDRNKWLAKALGTLPPGIRLLDAGAGELRNKPHCAHLHYVSQDLCQYEGSGDAAGLQTGTWDTSKIDIVCDITNIPEASNSFDAILCSEVFEHLPSAQLALKEFQRLLKPGGTLIMTAPFASYVHFAPYHYATGFSRYWYEYHLSELHFTINELSANGDWFAILKQEVLRWPSMARKSNPAYLPFVYLAVFFCLLALALKRSDGKSSDLACFGWHCIATKRVEPQ